MCYHKTATVNYDELTEHYNASFNGINAELEPVRERFEVLLQKDPQLAGKSIQQAEEIFETLIAYSQKGALPACYTKEELSELKRLLKILTGIDGFGLHRYYENGFDFLPSPIITAGAPEEFKLFNWGFIKAGLTNHDYAMKFRANTLNCISEEMYDKDYFKSAVVNAQRCLIPCTGGFEWRWLDEEGTIKVPYHFTFTDRKVRSMAGIYSRYKDPLTNQYIYNYSILTTRANEIFNYIHKHKKRMPVFIDKDNEKAFLNRDLSKLDVLNLCQPSSDKNMDAYSISKFLTARNVNANVPKVIAPMDYNQAINEATKLLQSGNKPQAIALLKDVFANSESEAKKMKSEDLETIAMQPIRAELRLAS
jgi:putative SOS response-associated peptidase YedK